MVEPIWLEPYPSWPAGDDTNPESRYEHRESVELAFVSALQHLPASQRAVLILREVLQFSAADVALALDTTVTAVNSTLQRARKSIDERIAAGSQQAELSSLGEQAQRELVAAFVAAWERVDVVGMVELLAEDARFNMPPLPAWFSGRTQSGSSLSAPSRHRGGWYPSKRTASLRLPATRATGAVRHSHLGRSTWSPCETG